MLVQNFSFSYLLLFYNFKFLSVLFQVYILSTREMTCVSIFFIFTLSSFLGDEAVSGGFLARIVPAPPFIPFYCFNNVRLPYSVTKPSSFRSCNLSVVLHNTCIVFVKRPSELGLNVTMISLVCPGRTGRFSHRGLVQPQVVSTYFMRRGCVPVFFRVNIACGRSS